MTNPTPPDDTQLQRWFATARSIAARRDLGWNQVHADDIVGAVMLALWQRPPGPAREYIVGLQAAQDYMRRWRGRSKYRPVELYQIEDSIDMVAEFYSADDIVNQLQAECMVALIRRGLHGRALAFLDYMLDDWTDTEIADHFACDSARVREVRRQMRGLIPPEFWPSGRAGGDAA